MCKGLKLLFVTVMALVLLLGMSQASFAAKSIVDPDKPVVVNPGGDSDGGSGDVTVTEPDTGSYKSEETKDVVEAVNGGKDLSPSDIIGSIPQTNPDKQDPENFITTGGLYVNTKLYDRITKFYDVRTSKTGSGTLKYKVSDNGTVTMQSDVLKGLEASDVLIMVIDPDTGEIYLISPDELDSEKGTLTADFPVFGPFCIIQKIPLVVKNVNPDLYPNEDVAASVEKLCEENYGEDYFSLIPVAEAAEKDDEIDADEKVSIRFSSLLDAFGIDDDTVTVDKDVDVKVDDYSAANVLADLVVRVNEKTYGYKLNTKVRADLYQDIADIDVGRILDYADISYDKEGLENGDKDAVESLLDIKPFTLKNSFAYHVDASTGDVSIAYEPVISFKVPAAITDENDIKSRNLSLDESTSDVDAHVTGVTSFKKIGNIKDADFELGDLGLYSYAGTIKDKSEAEKKAAEESKNDESTLSDEDKDILTWEVPDVEMTDEDNICMLISSDKYLGMGPFLLFMPEENSGGFGWWWIAIVAALAVIVIAVIVSRKKKGGNTKVANG